MSRIFTDIPQKNYAGLLASQPIKVGNARGQCIPLFINWANQVYATPGSTSTLINVNIDAQKNVAISQISSIYIDNTNSGVPIFVNFIDTGYVVVAPPNSAAWYPVFTNGKLFQIVAEGLQQSALPQTRIFVTDVFIPPYTDIEVLQSQSLGRATAGLGYGLGFGGAAPFAPFALGDITDFATLGFSNVNSQAVFGFSQTGGFVYITDIFGFAFGFSNANDLAFSLSFHNFNDNRDILAVDFSAPGNLITDKIVFENHNCCLRLDASKKWGLLNQSLVTSNVGQVRMSLTLTASST